jgi:Zn-dependent protease
VNRKFDPMTIVFLLVMVFLAVRNSHFGSPLEWAMNELLLVPGILVGLSFHEYGHAAAADRLGDPTPRNQGRLSINPAAHIDPIGLLTLLFIGFGWGKPVEINPRNFKHPRRDDLLVSVAGVAMNLLMAVVFTVVVRLYSAATGAVPAMSGAANIVYLIFFYVVEINLVLMIFNLLPIPPLDGFNLLTEIFNLRRYGWWYQLYEKGFLILLILIVFNFTDAVLTPCINFFLRLLAGLGGWGMYL